MQELKKQSLQALKRVDNPPNICCGHLLLIMSVNCLSGLPIEEDLLQSGYDLETALRQVDYIAQRGKPQRPVVGIPVRLPT